MSAFNTAMKNKIAVVATLFVFLLVAIFFVGQANQGQSGNSNTPTQQNTAPASTTAGDKNLEECLKNARDSEARPEIIEEGVQACRDRFR